VQVDELWLSLCVYQCMQHHRPRVVDCLALRSTAATLPNSMNQLRKVTVEARGRATPRPLSESVIEVSIT